MGGVDDQDGEGIWWRRQLHSSVPWWAWLATAIGGMTAVTKPFVDGKAFTLGDDLWVAMGIAAVVASVALAVFNRSEQRPRRR